MGLFSGLLRRIRWHQICRENHIEYSAKSLHHCKIEICGRDNTLLIGAGCSLHHCNLFILGNHCRVEIGAHSTLESVHIWCQDDGSELIIGEGFTQERNGILAAMEGARLQIGADCMFSSDVEIRNGDSHTIFDRADGLRTNAARSVTIGDHVWLTAHTRVMKGAVLAAHTVLANSSIACGKLETPYAIYSGAPAKILRTEIDWDRARSWEAGNKETKLHKTD
ncbi:MAG: hypothetical protein RR330_05740 [Alistipes sp.]